VRRLVVIGAGGHARVVVEALRSHHTEIIGFVTNDPQDSTGVMRELPCIGTDGDLLAAGPQGTDLVNGIGSTGKSEVRRKLFDRFRKGGFRFATVVHPAATVASDVVLGEGAQVMAGAVLQPGVVIGANAIVNTGALVDHDVRIGEHAHIAPGACLAGGVTIGTAAHVGAGSTVIQNVRVGDGALIAAGAAVTSDVPAATMVAGVPARTLGPM
jgi:sugar O-acyltransferase (sialic acid O-acetyltransferase NeuD family)